jgi:pimeloyl-ACP methyl ester carboxylesterase
MELLLLHGAIGSSSQLLSLLNLLSGNLPYGKFQPFVLDFGGHASRCAEAGEFSIKRFAHDVLSWMEEKKFETIDIFGYSMGGYVALYLARHYPQKVNRIFTLATKFRWTTEIASREISMLDPVRIAEKVPAFAKTLAERHSPELWRNVLQKTAAMMVSMGEKNVLDTDDFQLIRHKVMLSVGDRDKMLTLDETLEVYDNLGDAALLVLPETGHPIEGVKLEVLAFHIHNFFG